MTRPLAAALAGLLAGLSLAGCAPKTWVDEEVVVDADGLPIHGTYRHLPEARGPAALLISESGGTDRNGDNTVAGPVGNMRQLAQYLSDHGVASLRYDKIGTGSTGLGRYTDHPADIGSAVYTDGARAAAAFLAGRPDTGPLSVYAVGEGAIHAMELAVGGTPPIHSLALLQPLAARYLDLISGRVAADVASAVRGGAKSPEQGERVLAAWRAAVAQIRTSGTAPADLPDGLSAILNPGNATAVADADAIDPLELAGRIPAGTPVLLSCSDSDAQADCSTVTPLADALSHTDLTFLRLTGVNHVLRDDPTDSIANYARPGPLSAQLTAALDVWIAK